MLNQESSLFVCLLYAGFTWPTLLHPNFVFLKIQFRKLIFAMDQTPNRFDRIIAILIQLQSRKIVKAKDLADRFGVTLRTIYRDIKSLDSAGVPIIGEAGTG